MFQGETEAMLFRPGTVAVPVLVPALQDRSLDLETSGVATHLENLGKIAFA